MKEFFEEILKNCLKNFAMEFLKELCEKFMKHTLKDSLKDSPEDFFLQKLMKQCLLTNLWKDSRETPERIAGKISAWLGRI